MILLKLKIDLIREINNNYALIIKLIEKNAIFYQNDFNYKSFYDSLTQMYIYPVSDINVSKLVKKNIKYFYVPKTNNVKLLYYFETDRLRKIFLKILFNTFKDWIASYCLHEFKNIKMNINNNIWLISCDE